ncbi:DUF2892 domain-containing protein [Halomicroarcula sp. F13]|uniref:DUF2892 domain-containing protein n=1 Tax=Haloarcula rubra TaxID=2487747 RepID=A0AAW4PRZ7_9EURY|nr:YgaP-like transmembrane domain [Halomicroarcula rubra]MBX0324368.1 DUF2892 domain-containing protein [Halomicroarcula rubra]
MRQNISDSERIGRGVLGIWLIVIAVGALRARRRTVAAIAGIAGIGLIQNAVTGFCGGNWLFNIDSTKE